jgi:catechol 2,3-dioxygenase-like lactoylglutathione lyase family enzyme
MEAHEEVAVRRPKVSIWHVAIPVTNLEAAIAFYCDGLGFNLLGRDEYPSKRQAFVSVEEEGFAIELFQPKNDDPTSVSRKPDHLAFEVDNLESFRVELLERKTVTHVPEVERYDNGVQYLGMKDPDGMSIEFFQGRKIYDAFLASQSEGSRSGTY